MTPLEYIIHTTTRKFFETKVKQNEITSNIGQYTKENAPFRVTHKLINPLLL